MAVNSPAGSAPAHFLAARKVAAYERPAGLRSVAGAVVLLLHVALLLAWSQLRSPPPPPRPKLVTLQVLPLLPEVPPPPPLPPPPPAPPAPTPPPPPKPAAAPQPKPQPKPQLVAPPAPPQVPAPAEPRVAPPAAPAFRHADSSDEWVQPTAPAAVAGAGARRAPSDYADAVKSRVISQVVYPENARYPPPRGFKGDPRELMRECMVPYEVVVDRQGAIVSYQIERCGDPLLDAAAEEAVRKAQPFPPPPPGAEQYRVYGTVNFLKPRLGPAK